MSHIQTYVPRTRRVDVKVTGDTIETSVQANSSHCMIADAIRAAVPGATSISVDLQTIRFSDPERRLRYVYLTPRIAQLALVDFDQGDKPDPFSFRLDRAHIVAMRDHPRRTARPDRQGKVSPAVRQSLQKARDTKFQGLGKTTLRAGSNSDHVPDRVGGQAPPSGALAGGDIRGRGKGGVRRATKAKKVTPVTAPAQRRQFGLRAMERGTKITSPPEATD